MSFVRKDDWEKKERGDFHGIWIWRYQDQPGDFLLSFGTPRAAGGWGRPAVQGIRGAGGDPEPGQVPGGGGSEYGRTLR